MWGVAVACALSAYLADGGHLKFPTEEEIYERDRGDRLRAQTRRTRWLNLSLVGWLAAAIILAVYLLGGVVK